MSDEDKVLRMPVFRFQLVGGGEQSVTVPNSVQVQWEMERVRSRYPTSSEAPTLWASWLTWATARRDGLVDTDMPFQAFLDQLQVVQFEEAVPVGPTKKARGRASSST
jgi:hypothetical protein